MLPLSVTTRTLGPVATRPLGPVATRPLRQVVANSGGSSSGVGVRFEPCKQNFKTHDAIASHLRDSGKHKQNPNRSLILVPTTSGANVNQSQSTLGSNSAFDDLDLGGGLSVPK